MPKRNIALYIDDILESIDAIQSFTQGMVATKELAELESMTRHLQETMQGKS